MDGPSQNTWREGGYQGLTRSEEEVDTMATVAAKPLPLRCRPSLCIMHVMALQWTVNCGRTRRDGRRRPRFLEAEAAPFIYVRMHMPKF
jgi:hypothetical protein